MKKILNAPADYTDDMLRGIYASHSDQVKYTADCLRCYCSAKKTEGKVAIVEGVEQLRGAPVMSHDLRGGAALVVAGLCAKGRTEVGGVEYIRRGYENLAGNLASLGARIREVGEPAP